MRTLERTFTDDLRTLGTAPCACVLPALHTKLSVTVIVGCIATRTYLNLKTIVLRVPGTVYPTVLGENYRQNNRAKFTVHPPSIAKKVFVMR